MSLIQTGPPPENFTVGVNTCVLVVTPGVLLLADTCDVPPTPVHEVPLLVDYSAVSRAVTVEFCPEPSVGVLAVSLNVTV